MLLIVSNLFPVSYEWNVEEHVSSEYCLVWATLKTIASALFYLDPAVSETVGRSRKPQEYVNGFDIIIALQRWQLERVSFLHQSDGNNC